MPTDAPVAVPFGAGNIGRGFMGELFSRSGYHTRFVEIDPAIVQAINRRGRYQVRRVAADPLWERLAAAPAGGT